MSETKWAGDIQEYREKRYEVIKRFEALKRLQINPDFIALFVEGYIEKESVRIVSLLAEPRFNQAETKDYYRTDLHERLASISRFREYLQNIEQLADYAQYELNKLDEDLTASDNTDEY